MKRIITLASILTLLVVYAISAQVFVFYAPDCEDCYEILTDSLFAQSSIKQILYFNVNKTANYEFLLMTETAFKKRCDDFPVVISGHALYCRDDIIPNLQIIQNEESNVFLPDSVLRMGEYEEKPQWDNTTVDTLIKPSSDTRIYIAFFTEITCRNCARTEKMLNYFQQKNPKIFKKTYNALDPEHQKIQEAISIAFGVPESKRLIAPTLFLCDTFLIDHEITEANLESVILAHRKIKSLPPWQKGKKFEHLAHSEIIERFKQFGPAVVFIAGLVDGVNPCAFATIVFFLSFMTLIGRTRKEIAVTGITFVIVVFIVYLVIGLFLYRMVELRFLIPVRHIIYYTIAAFACILAIISISDAVMLARGKPEKTMLRLPKAVKRRMEKTIIRESKLRNYIVSAGISALVVSFLEFSCTGQVYIPTIFFVSGLANLRLKAVWFLVLYNVAFISPLLLLFFLFIIGVSSQQLYSFMRRRAFLLKVATAFIFLALAASLILIR